MSKLRSKAYVYEHLICEFDHWDFCLVGLCKIDEKYFVCKVIDTRNRKDLKYSLKEVEMTKERMEYLEDYRKAYYHWFYEDGKRGTRYDGRDLKWFNDKWQTNPIVNEEEKIR